jgi:hypothetical protein
LHFFFNCSTTLHLFARPSCFFFAGHLAFFLAS